MKRFMNDESGVLTFEWILLITILVIGVICGLAAVRDALDVELCDVAQAIGSIDQSYSYYGLITQVSADRNVEFKPGENADADHHEVCGSFFNDGITYVTITSKKAHGLDGDEPATGDYEHSKG